MKTKEDSQVRGPFPVKLLTAGAALLLSTTLAFGQAVTPTNETTEAKKDDVVKMEKVEVVGSRIKRLDTETVSPTVQLKADDIKASGFPNIADAIRALPFNAGQALTPTDAGTSFTPGVNTFNLRGLGNNNTLVLINGRRAVPYGAAGFDGFQTVFDLNSIPEAAIESVQILKDGGSAIYGSDAVGGVVDFRLIKNYEGLAVTYQVGDYFNTSALQQKIEVVTGATSGKASIVVIASWEEQAAVYARDLSYTRDADKTNIAHKAEPSYIYTGDDASRAYVFSPSGFDFTNPITDGMFDRRSVTGFPGYIQTTSSSGSRRTFAEPTNTPTTATAVVGRNLYNFQEVAGFLGSDRRYSAYSNFRYDFSDYLYGFAEISYTRVEARNDSAGTPATLGSEQGLTIGSRLTLPSYNPYNPWGVNLTSGARRLVETGARINDTSSETPRLLAGLGGKINDIGFLKNLSWEVGALYTKNTVTNTNPGTVPDYKLQQALNGLVRAGDGSLVWQPQATPAFDPTRVYFNWFGYNEQAFADFLLINNPVTASIQFVNLDFKLNGELWDLPGGAVGFAFGGEHRAEKMASIKTDVNATGMIIGGSSGSSAWGDRTLDALYLELSVPVAKWLEFDLAGRYESYSDDGFKKTVRPKVGFKVRPVSWLILRGSYAESFKAPDLSYLFTKATTTFSSVSQLDPVTGDNVQIQTLVSGNPNLKPETTDTYFGGITIAPTKGLLKELELSVDYFEFHQKDLLGQLGDLYSTAEFLDLARQGIEPFASKVVRDPVTNTLLYVLDDYDNLGKQTYKGWDFDVSYKWRTERLGRFTARVMGTYISSFNVEGDDVVGTRTLPRVSGTLMLSWSHRDWLVNLYTRYIGQRRVTSLLYTGDTLDSFEGSPAGTYGDLYMHYLLKKQIVVNPSVTYSGFKNMEITLGVNNVFNQNPPVDPIQGTGFTTGVNLGAPAFWYIRVNQKF